jgi:LacI family transcriptional regulator
MDVRHTPRIILFLDASRGFGRGILSGIARYSSLNGPWTFYRKPPTYLTSGSGFNLKELKAWNPDGIICSIAHAQNLSSLRVPMIGYDPGKYTGRIPYVTSNHDEAGRLAARHLLDLGHRHFAFCGYASLGWSKQRGDSFCETIKNAGFDVDVYQNAAKISWSKEEPLVEEWIQSLPKPVGMFCVNDDRAASIMETSRVLGFGVPEDISIIGADDDEYVCELENPPLSSVCISSEQAGYEAAGLMHRMIDGRERMEGQRIIAHASGITARQSTDVMMIQNEEVRKALHFIRENANQPIRVADVVKASSLSHRALNQQFYAELGNSICKQLVRARIDYICRLLADTDMQVQEVAFTVGYEDYQHFSRYFKRATGLSPKAYRRKISPP